MEVSLALYRKYRSKDFGSVLGQEHVVGTLANALKRNQISHAYLFTGPRGVGKTSVARLLARSLNCQSQDSAKRPCNECESCQIPIDGHLDLIEIDAASNRRIDEIRELRDKINLAPAIGRYKVYIIDEVHMLTSEAFNALLKTLEEPPAHAVFILATTEAHKLPETIISRTQRFSFKALVPEEIIKGLGEIARLEEVKIDQSALGLIAAAARGSMRDAISMLDQVASSGESAIDAGSVRRILGWSDLEALEEISLALVSRDAATALRILDRSVESGASITQFLSQLIDRWRDVLLGVVGVRTAKGDRLLEAVKENYTIQQAVAVVEVLMTVSKSSWPELALEAALVRIAIGDTEKAQETQKTSRTQSLPVESMPAAVIVGDDAVLSRPASGDEWNKALQLIKMRNNSLYALLRSCGASFDGDELVLSCRFNFHRDRLEEAKNRQVVEAALKQSFRRVIRVRTTVEGKPAEKISTDSELVSSALEILGGEVVDE